MLELIIYPWQFQLCFPQIMMTSGLIFQKTFFERFTLPFFLSPSGNNSTKQNTGSTSIIMQQNALAAQYSHPKHQVPPLIHRV
jgi:hypothetical protein